MIDKRIFATGMGVLTGAFGRQPLDAPTSLAYYDALSPLLSTAQFEQAVRDVVAQERFWPSPAVILEAAGVRPQTRAALHEEGARAFAAVRRWLGAKGGRRHITAAEYHTELGDAMRAAIQAMGGLAAVEDVTAERLPKVERDFAAHFAEAIAKANEPAIAKAPDARALPASEEPRTTLPPMLRAS